MWCKVANTATALVGITVPSHENKCSYELFNGKTPHYMETLHTFREIAVTKDPTNTTTKLDSHGRVCMFLGYSEDHSQKVSRF